MGKDQGKLRPNFVVLNRTSTCAFSKLCEGRNMTPECAKVFMFKMIKYIMNGDVNKMTNYY